MKTKSLSHLGDGHLSVGVRVLCAKSAEQVHGIVQIQNNEQSEFGPSFGLTSRHGLEEVRSRSMARAITI